MSRSLRLLALTGAVVALIALPASASAATTTAPTSLDFGSVPVGQQGVNQVVTLTESCTSPLCILSIIPDSFAPVVNATGGFSQANGCPALLSALSVALPASCTIDVSFVPNALGPLTGLLTTGAGGPDVTLSGTGTAPPAAPTKHRKKCKKKHKRSASAAKKRCKKKKRR